MSGDWKRKSVMALGSFLGPEVSKQLKDHYAEGFGWRYEGLADWRTEDIFAKLNELKVPVTPASFREQAMAAGGWEALTDLWEKEAQAPGLWEDFLLFAPEELWKRLLADMPCPELLFSEIGELIKEENDQKRPLEAAELGKRFDAAIRLAAMAQDKSPDDPEGWYRGWHEKQYWDTTNWLINLSWGLARAGMIDQAEALCRRWAPITEEKTFLADLGVILAEASRRQQALAQVEDNLRRFPRSFWILVHAADAYQALAERDRALELFRQARAFAGDREDHVVLLDREVKVLEELGRATESAELRRRADMLRERADDRPDDDDEYDVAEPEAHDEASPLPAKIGRNAPCPCGSGKKYKKCCL